MREQQPEIRETGSSAAGASPMDAGERARHRIRILLLMTVPGLLFTLLGPLGTYQIPFFLRFLFWMPTMAFGALAGWGVTVLLSKAAFLQKNPALHFAFAATAITFIMTAVVLFVSNLLFSSQSAPFSLMLVFYVGIITLAMSAVAQLAIGRERRIQKASAPSTPLGATPLPALASRLPASLREQPILALQGEDHYVRIHTQSASELVLIRLSDAAAEMTTIVGARTHRSWWVNRSAIQGVSRRDGRVALILVNGLEVPVGRSYASELKEAGWLSG